MKIKRVVQLEKSKVIEYLWGKTHKSGYIPVTIDGAEVFNRVAKNTLLVEGFLKAATYKLEEI